MLFRSMLQLNDVCVPSGHIIGKPELLFSKVEDQFVDAQIEKLEQSKKSKVTNPKAKPMKDNISFDDFTKLDIRVGKILAAEKIEKADKLLKLKVDTGVDIRTVVSGIALDYAPEEVVGKSVSILTNLAPRKIRGVESQGMILMAENNDGNLAFVEPSKQIEAGSEIR